MALLFGLLSGCESVPAKKAVTNAEIGSEYDLIYVASDIRGRVNPSEFLVQSVGPRDQPQKGSAALDIGSGNGRNSFYLAERGFEVTSLDLSRVGLDLTAEEAKRRKLPVKAVLKDVNAFDFGVSRWDVILMIDFPFPYQALLPKIVAGLKPGGRVIIESVSVREPRRDQEPIEFTHMRRDDLTGPFTDFKILYDREASWPSVWGGRAVMIRFSAQKPL